MARVRRYDAGSTGRVTETPTGGLRIEGAPTRVGVFTYRDVDGNEWNELRPPEEVFDPESVSTMRSIPVTHLHPAELVTSETWESVAKGHVGDDVRADGDFIMASIVLDAADIVDAVKRDQLHDLSAGYDCEMDDTAGEFRGEKYDRVQRRIRYNHVAVLPKGTGRGGTNVSLRMDGAAAQVTTRAPARPETPTMKQIKVKGHARPFRTDSDEDMTQLQDAITANEGAASEKEASLSDQVATAMKQLAMVQAKVHELEAKAKVADDADAPTESVEPSEESMDAHVAVRERVEAMGKKVLGADFSIRGKKTNDVRRDVLTKLVGLEVAKAQKFDSADAKTLFPLFESFAGAFLQKRNDGLDRVLSVVHDTTGGSNPAGSEKTVEDAQAEVAKRERERGSAPIRKGA
jgi:uncharacterized protein